MPKGNKPNHKPAAPLALDILLSTVCPASLLAAVFWLWLFSGDNSLKFALAAALVVAFVISTYYLVKLSGKYKFRLLNWLWLLLP